MFYFDYSLMQEMDLKFSVLEKTNLKDTKLKYFLYKRTFNNSVFSVGDILTFSYRIKYFNFFFEGLCIASKRRLFSSNNTILLRNVLSNVGIELLVSPLYYRLFFYGVGEHKRKKLNYHKGKLYFLRNRLNRESRVK